MSPPASVRGAASESVVEGQSYNPEPLAPESMAIIQFLRNEMAELMGTDGDLGLICHFDLHETTDTEIADVIPTKSARDSQILDPKIRPTRSPMASFCSRTR